LPHLQLLPKLCEEDYHLQVLLLFEGVARAIKTPAATKDLSFEHC